MAFTVNGPKWKQVRLEGQPGYWIQVDDNDSPIDLDEEGNIRVYSSKTDKNPQFGRIKQIGGIQRERDDKFAAQERARQIDEKVNRNQGALADLFGNMLTLGMANEVAEGADNLRQGNYLRGTAQVLSPLMFMSGPVGITARAGIGTYNLANENGVRKTWDLLQQGRYGRAALSGAGDILNGLLTVEGYSKVPQLLENVAARYGTGAARRWGQGRTISRAFNEGIKETQLGPTTFEPKVLDLSNPQNWNNGLWDIKYMQAIRRGDMAEAQRLRDLHSTLVSGVEDNRVFAHSTPAKFTTFDKSHFGETDAGFNGKGFYFSTTRIPENSSMPTGPHGEIPTMNYGPNKMYVYIKGDREYDVGNPQRNFFEEPNTVGIVTKSLYEEGKPTEIIAGNPKNIKLADAVARDDAGNIVELSKRDDFTSDDIRGKVENLYNHPGAFLGNTVKENGTVNGEEILRRLYQKPESSDWMQLTLEEPLMTTENPKLSRGQFEVLFNSGKIKKPEDLYKYMTAPQAQRIFKMASKVKKALGKFSSSNLKDKKDLEFYNAVLERSTQGLKGTRGTSTKIRQVVANEKAMTLEGKLKSLQEQYHPMMQKAFDRIKAKYGEGIDWNWENNGYFAEMPLDFKIKPVYDPHTKGISDKRPFIQRFYENVEKIIKKGGLMDKVLESGDLKLNAKNQWVGRMESGKFERVDPTLYIISKLENFKKSGNRLTINKEPIPYHGTMGTNSGNAEYSALSQKYADGAGEKNAIFTVIRDNMPGVSSMMNKYKGQGGVSIPFFRRLERHPDFSIMDAGDPQIIKAGSHGYYSNDYGIWGELKNYFKGGNGGYAQEVRSVSDPQSSGQRVNEYNFGAGTQDVKSIWNTLDFEPQEIIRNPDGSIKEIIKTSPFAYNPSTITINNQYT